jgi:hypothetical protein
MYYVYMLVRKVLNKRNLLSYRAEKSLDQGGCRCSGDGAVLDHPSSLFPTEWTSLLDPLHGSLQADILPGDIPRGRADSLFRGSGLMPLTVIMRPLLTLGIWSRNICWLAHARLCEWVHTLISSTEGLAGLSEPLHGGREFPWRKICVNGKTKAVSFIILIVTSDFNEWSRKRIWRLKENEWEEKNHWNE